MSDRESTDLYDALVSELSRSGFEGSPELQVVRRDVVGVGWFAARPRLVTHVDGGTIDLRFLLFVERVEEGVLPYFRDRPEEGAMWRSAGAAIGPITVNVRCRDLVGASVPCPRSTSLDAAGIAEAASVARTATLAAEELCAHATDLTVVLDLLRAHTQDYQRIAYVQLLLGHEAEMWSDLESRRQVMSSRPSATLEDRLRRLANFEEWLRSLLR